MFVWNAFSDAAGRLACWTRPPRHTWVVGDEEILFSICEMEVVVETRFGESTLPKLFQDPRIQFDDVVANFEPSLVKGEITAATPTSQLRHSWHLDRNITVCLMESGDTLQWKVVNAARRTTHWTPIPLLNKQRGELLKELLELKQPVSCKEGVPVLEKTEKQLGRWLVGREQKMCITLKAGQPVWQIVDALSRTTRWYPVDLSPFAGQKDQLKKIAAQRPSIENGRVVVTPCASYRSHFGEHTVSEKKWALTLINAGSSQCRGSASSIAFGHAQLIVEGVENGFPLARIVHIGQREAQSDRFRKISYAHPTVIYWKSRSPSKCVDKEIAKEMLGKIDLETPIPFNAYSNRSCHRTYNCATWTIELGESCGMQFPVGWFERFGTRPGICTPIANANC